MYRVTLNYKETKVTSEAECFEDARIEAWLEMCRIVLVYYVCHNAEEVMLDCRKNTRMYCEIF